MNEHVKGDDNDGQMNFCSMIIFFISEFIHDRLFIEELLKYEKVYILFQIFEYMNDENVISDTFFIFYSILEKGNNNVFKNKSSDEIFYTFKNILKNEYFDSIYSLCIKRIEGNLKNELNRNLISHLTLFVKSFLEGFEKRSISFSEVID